MTATREQPAQQMEPEPSEALPSGTRLDVASVVRMYQAGVWRYVRFLGADRSEADDLTQETFLAFARGECESAERCDKQLADYLRVIARNQLLALRRRQHREINTVELDVAEHVWASATGKDGGLTEYLDALRECVEKLDGRARQAVNLHYHDRESRETIATTIQMKPDGVKTLLRRTRQVLRECVERKIGGEVGNTNQR